MFGSFFFKKCDFYQAYYSQLSKLYDDEKLIATYHETLNNLDDQDESYEERLLALNKVYKEVLSRNEQRSQEDQKKSQEDQWKERYLKQVRICLINDDAMYSAFQCTGNLQDGVTQHDLIENIKGLHYSKQLPGKLLASTTRPTTIQVAIHVSSIPIEVSEYYKELMLSSESSDSSESLEAVREQEKQFYEDLYEILSNELKALYHQYQQNKVNYLYNSIVKMPSDGKALIAQSTLTWDELDYLRNRLRTSSLGEKGELHQIVVSKMSSVQGDSQEQGRSSEMQVIYSKNKGRK